MAYFTILDAHGKLPYYSTQINKRAKFLYYLREIIFYIIKTLWVFELTLCILCCRLSKKNDKFVDFRKPKLLVGLLIVERLIIVID